MLCLHNVFQFLHPIQGKQKFKQNFDFRFVIERKKSTTNVTSFLHAQHNRRRQHSHFRRITFLLSYLFIDTEIEQLQKQQNFINDVFKLFIRCEFFDKKASSITKTDCTEFFMDEQGHHDWYCLHAYLFSSGFVIYHQLSFDPKSMKKIISFLSFNFNRLTFIIVELLPASFILYTLYIYLILMKHTGDY